MRTTLILAIILTAGVSRRRPAGNRRSPPASSTASRPTRPARRCPASTSRRATSTPTSPEPRSPTATAGSSFLQLPPGRYTVTFTLAGFATLVQENVELTVGQSVTLPAADEGVGRRRNGHRHVAAAGRSSRRARRPRARSTRRRSRSTPILGRKFEDLLTLTPGVSIVQGPDGDEITFAGQRGIFNNISLDGGDYNNGFFGEQVGGQRAADRHHARRGQGIPGHRDRRAAPSSAAPPAAWSTSITKSGTNQTHGSAVPLPAARGADRRTLRRQAARRTSIASSSAARSAGRSAKDKAFYFVALEGITRATSSGRT